MSAYPVQPLGEDNDPRFTFGLVLDVARVLASHGFPDLTDPAVARGGDLVDLQQTLFRFIYTSREETP